jgi:hypothetical protein
MVLPLASVHVTLDRVTGLDPGGLGHARMPFALAVIGPRGLGRRLLRAADLTASHAITLHGPQAPYEVELTPTVEEEIPVGLFLWNDKGLEGCETLGAVRGAIPLPWADGPLRLTGTNGLGLECTMRVVRVPAQGRRVAVPRRPLRDQGPHAVLSVAPIATPMVVVTIVEVQGLYKPGATAPRDAGRAARQAEYLAGYRSEDDRGRIYLERDLQGGWARETQLIELTAELTPLGVAIPPDARIKWTVIDPDDPSNDGRLNGSFGPVIDDQRPNVLEEWGPDLDPNDYDPPAADGSQAPRGARGDDNQASPATAFQEVPGYALEGAAPPEAYTAVAAGRSKVRVLCPGHAGDNLIVRAELATGASVQIIAAQTGVMTLWHRIDVEYRRMPGARDLSLTGVADVFRTAFVQMDFTPPLPAPDQESFGADFASSETALRQYIERTFAHRGQGGWFYLLSAQVMFPFTRQQMPADMMDATFGQNPGSPARPAPGAWGPPMDFVMVQGVYPRVGTVYVEVPGGGLLQFFVAAQRSYRAMNRTVFVLHPHDIQDQFEAGDGSESNAYAHTVYYYLSGRLDGSFEPGGYRISGTGRVMLQAESLNPAGISPAIELHPGQRYFAGRTVVFTEGSSPDGDMEFIVHELVHGFGLPHKCGCYGFTPGFATAGGVARPSCLMNYGGHAMIVDRGRRLADAPRPPPNGGGLLCGKHIRELRRTVLSHNPALGWG